MRALILAVLVSICLCSTAQAAIVNYGNENNIVSVTGIEYGGKMFDVDFIPTKRTWVVGEADMDHSYNFVMTETTCLGLDDFSTFSHILSLSLTDEAYFEIDENGYNVFTFPSFGPDGATSIFYHLAYNMPGMEYFESYAFEFWSDSPTNIIGYDEWGFIGHTDNVMIARVSAAPVPEPATMLLLGIGIVGAVGRRKLSKSKKTT